jgi:hypothetical protein
LNRRIRHFCLTVKCHRSVCESIQFPGCYLAVPGTGSGERHDKKQPHQLNLKFMYLHCQAPVKEPYIDIDSSPNFSLIQILTFVRGF